MAIRNDPPASCEPRACGERGQGVPESVRDQLATSYRALPSVADDTRRYAQRVLRGDAVETLPPYRTLGLLTEADARQVGEFTGVVVAGFDYALDASSVRHVRRQHGGESERDRGRRPVTGKDYALLPKLVNRGERQQLTETSANGSALVRMVYTKHGETYVAVFEVRRKRKMLTLYVRTGNR